MTKAKEINPFKRVMGEIMKAATRGGMAAVTMRGTLHQGQCKPILESMSIKETRGTIMKIGLQTNQTTWGAARKTIF